MSDGNNLTSVAEIPEDWKLIPIYELRNKIDRYSFTGGPFGSDLKSEHYTTCGVRVIQLQDIGEGKFLDKSQIYTTTEKADHLVSCNIYPGEIILAKMAPVARCCKVPNTANRFVMCSDGIRLSVDSSMYDNEFVYQALNSEYFRKEAEAQSTGTTRARIGLNDLKLIPLAIPPTIKEQQKIAEVLYTVDEKIEVVEEQIKQTTELKKGLMQQLLTRGIGHIHFKASPIGEIPENWQVESFGELATNITTKFNGIDGRCIELEHIEQHTGKILGYDNFSSKASAKNHFIKSDVLFGKLRPYLRKYWFAEFDGCCTTELMVFRAKENADPKFLFYTVQLESFILNSVSKSFGTKMPRTSWHIISDYELPVPSLQEQKEISLILTTVDEKLEALQQKKKHYQELKKGLMQQLLTGKLRVKPVMENEVFA